MMVPAPVSFSRVSSSVPLPIDPFLPEILDTVGQHRALVLTAAPGAGKTTRVAPALALQGPTLLLQPRRVAARSLARFIAASHGWTLGEEVGWQVRFERRFSSRTRLLVATEGVLTARAQADPLLSAFSTVVLDEFHERSLHADLALALARQAWLARGDLRLVVMSATMDAGRVAAFLDGCPVVQVPGRVFPLEVEYAPGEPLREAVRWALQRTSGSVLCFLPGAPEIRRAAGDVGRVVRDAGAELVSLHGSLAAEEQDAAIQPGDTRRIILATNIAETSLTVPGVTAVVDTGLHKVLRYDAARGIDSLDVERVSRDAADQRAGRAGRTAPGVVRRLWDERDRLHPHREPEIERVDLSGLVLDVLAWGGQPSSLEWLEAPPAAGLEAAWRLLERLGAVARRALTPLGERLRRIPLHPRLGRILLEGAGAREAAAACALLSERYLLPPRAATTSSDLLSVIDDWPHVPPHVQRSAREIEQLAADVVERRRPRIGDVEFRRALLAGYPDRVARRRESGSPRLVLSSGHGAVLAEESGVRLAPLLVALDVQAGPAGEARVRVASAIEREWLEPTARRIEHRFDARTGTVKAVGLDLYDGLVLD
jgi:ATP-dependent helicase HrpB